MNWISVTSSNLRAVAYDQARQFLMIRFQDGSVYEYYNVPLHVVDGLLAARSKGSYHHTHIMGHYRYRRIS